MRMSAPLPFQSRTDCGRPLVRFGPSATRPDHSEGLLLGGRGGAQTRVLSLKTQAGVRGSADLRDTKAEMFLHRREVGVVMQEHVAGVTDKLATNGLERPLSEIPR